MPVLSLPTGSDDSLFLWNSRTGELLCEVKRHAGPVKDCRFSPDSTLFASASHNWRVQCGKHQLLTTSMCRKVCVQQSQGCQCETGTSVTKGYRKRAGRQNQALPSRLLRPLLFINVTLSGLLHFTHCYPLGIFQVTASVETVCFSLDSKQLLSGAWDHMAILWDTQLGQMLRLFVGHDDIQSCDISLNAQYLVTRPQFPVILF
ncbi:LOW QUALITY PROTEIN: WD repeat-containing protein 38 [Macrochelys suwanniensis]